MRFSFRELSGCPKNHAFTVLTAHANGSEDRAVANGSIDAHFDVSGVDGEVSD